MEVMTKPEPAEEVLTDEAPDEEALDDESLDDETIDDEAPIRRVKLDINALDSGINRYMNDFLRQSDVPYGKMSEKEQENIIQCGGQLSRALTREVVDKVSTRGFDSIKVSITKAENNGKTIKVTLEALHSNAQAAELLMSAGNTGRLVIADAEQFFGGEMPKADPDQPEIPLSNDDVDIDEEHDTADEGAEADNEDDEINNQFDETGITESA